MRVVSAWNREGVGMLESDIPMFMTDTGQDRKKEKVCDSGMSQMKKIGHGQKCDELVMGRCGAVVTALFKCLRVLGFDSWVVQFLSTWWTRW